MTIRTQLIFVLALALIMVAPRVAFANDGGDRVQFFQNIDVAADDRAGSVVCMFCSIRMAGSCGDAVAIFGNIVVDGTASGDVVSVGGGIKLGEDASVGGDAVAIGQGLFRHPNAVIKGQTVSQSGAIIFLGLIIIPLLPVIIVVALVVWLLRRNRYTPSQQVVYRR